MNKVLKVTAGTMVAAALMVGCNMNDEANESLMNEPNRDIEKAVDRENTINNNMNDRKNEEEDLMRDKKLNNEEDPFNDENKRERKDRNNMGE
ncbi:hypothetical protein [Jeotgalibacillus marinus]|uniref:Lipoprotein n=1 Tax=Jeotgalibacillus marinus TaxID=86667 RepID=A0ABV3Q0E6_9BACL